MPKLPNRQLEDIEGSASTPRDLETVCPVCGALLIQEKCKVVCRSDQCRYRIVLACNE